MEYFSEEFSHGWMFWRKPRYKK